MSSSPSPSSVQLTDAELAPLGIGFNVFTGAAGPLSAAGHHLRIAVTKYTAVFSGCDEKVFKGISASMASSSSTPTTASSSSAGLNGGLVRYLLEGSAKSLANAAHANLGGLGTGSTKWMMKLCPYAPPANASSRRETLQPPPLTEVICDASGLSVAACTERINGVPCKDKSKVSDGDKTAIDARTLGNHVLEADKFKTIRFVPKEWRDWDGVAKDVQRVYDNNNSNSNTSEDSTSVATIVGDLTIKGVTKEISCTARVRSSLIASDTASSSASASSSSLVVHCPFEQSYFGMKPFSLFGGALAVRDSVDVEVSVPLVSGA